MSRTIRVTVLVLALTMSFSALVASKGLLSAGMTNHGGSLRPYIYGEIGLFEDLRLGLDIDSAAVSISAWSGLGRGLYAEASWATFQIAKPQAARLGLWTNVSLGSNLDMLAWGGVEAFEGDPKLGLSLNAEVDVPLSSTIALFAGATASLLGPSPSTHGWVGIGTRF